MTNSLILFLLSDHLFFYYAVICLSIALIRENSLCVSLYYYLQAYRQQINTIFNDKYENVYACSVAFIFIIFFLLAACCCKQCKQEQQQQRHISYIHRTGFAKQIMKIKRNEMRSLKKNGPFAHSRKLPRKKIVLKK